MSHPDKMIGQGRTANVFDWEEGKVIKLFHEGFNKDWIEREYRMAKNVHEVGVSSPEVYELVETEEGVGIVFAKVSGESMFDLMQKAPWKLKQSARTLARLHAQMHASHTEHLPLQKEDLPERIRHGAEFLGEHAESIIRYLDKLPQGDSVCHGDFHPGNLMEDHGNWMVLDWTNAESGNPAGDVARTLIMLRSPYMPPGTNWLTGKLSKAFKSRLESVYLNEYLRISGMPLADIEAWMLPVAAARLREQVPGEREWLLGLIRERVDSSLS
ncbi:phosphotransferase family protein [Gorillibacterium timonense]|uniref:phosphotransferase family protein n=1 Tax=Gorillibacterium timonense TaxID=1689269 RepID=UPI00071CF273|nr:aminoglycoside phosphotransferase family protein [Gorillibacterium timonense]